MRKVLLGCCLAAMVAIPVMAQSGSAAAQAPPDPLATFVKTQFKTNANYLVKSAQEFPDEKYMAKLGTQPETRTYAALIGHIINENYLICSIAKGEANPLTKDYEKNPGTKTEMVTAMQGAVDYCAAIYNGLTDASGMEMVTPPAAPGRTPNPRPRVAILIFNLTHNNEEYGNIVGFFRANNLVPPSSENQNQGGGRRGN